VRYFSSGPDIYAAKRDENGDFGPGAAVTELNSAAADIQPNVREDGREVVFASNRDATAGQDIWASTRDTAHDPWSALVNLGPAVNSPANETRPSLSWDGETLYFGRTPGDESSASDIFVTTREGLSGS
jgi:Tol biopolymer transport system component